MALTDPQPHQRRLKSITLTVDATEVSGQIRTWKFDPGLDPGDPQYTFAKEGEGHNAYYEDVDGKPTLQLGFLDDWRDGGVSDFLWSTAPLTVVAFSLVHHQDFPGEQITLAGDLVIAPHPIGGDARATEVGDMTFKVLPGYTYDHA